MHLVPSLPRPHPGFSRQRTVVGSQGLERRVLVAVEMRYTQAKASDRVRGRMGGRTGRRTHGQEDGWMAGQMDRCVHTHTVRLAFTCVYGFLCVQTHFLLQFRPPGPPRAPCPGRSPFPGSGNTRLPRAFTSVPRPCPSFLLLTSSIGAGPSLPVSFLRGAVACALVGGWATPLGHTHVRCVQKGQGHVKVVLLQCFCFFLFLLLFHFLGARTIAWSFSSPQPERLVCQAQHVRCSVHAG